MAHREPLWRRYARLLRPDLAADVDDELRFHVDARIDDLKARGLTDSDARAQALREFGDQRHIREAVLAIDQRRDRSARRHLEVRDVFQDLRTTVRSLRRSPAFAGIAILCVALGVGLTATIFTAVNGILLRPLPYPGAESLVAVYERRPTTGEQGVNVGLLDYEAWRDDNTTLSSIAMWTWSSLTLSKDVTNAERIDGAEISASFLPTLGVTPMLGRNFTTDEERANAGRVILLGHGLWQRKFDGDRNIVGRSITVEAQPYTVVGVMPPGFAWPDNGEVWVPMNMDDEMARERGNRYLAGAIGRLKPGETVARAQADLDRIMTRLEAEYPLDNKGWLSDVSTLRDDLVGDLRRPLNVFLAAVAMVLIVACLNVANLMLVRGMAQQRDVGVRVALGAQRSRVIRQVLAESCLLAIVGGAIGLGSSRFGVHLLSLSFPNGVPNYVSFAIEPRIVGFVLGVTAVAALMFGLLPAWRATRLDVSRVLREGARTGGGRQTGRLRNGLVVGELALSVILLIGAGLLIRSYRSLTTTELGFHEDGILTARVSLPTLEYEDREKRRTYWRATWERLAALPGVEAVGSANGVPFSGWNVQATMSIEGRPTPPLGEELDVHYQNVSPGFFETIGARIVAGRGITLADRDTAQRIGVINETFAKLQFAGQDPVGKRLKYGRADSDQPWITIVGVVSDYRHYRLPQPMGPAMYLPQLRSADRSQSLVLRTSLDDPRSLVPAVTRVLASLEPDAPAYGVRTFREIVSQSLWRQRLQGQVLGLFAALALLLAAVGIYGVISYAVAQRSREIGVRMALGASRGEVTWWVFGQGGRLVAIGLVIGIAGALALTRTLGALLVGVSSTDLVTFASVPAVLAVVALLAVLLPARRASRVDPVVAMRAD